MDIDNLKKHEILELALLAKRLDPKCGVEEYIEILERFQSAVREDEARLSGERLPHRDTK